MRDEQLRALERDAARGDPFARYRYRLELIGLGRDPGIDRGDLVQLKTKGPDASPLRGRVLEVWPYPKRPRVTIWVHYHCEVIEVLGGDVFLLDRLTVPPNRIEKLLELFDPTRVRVPVNLGEAGIGEDFWRENIRPIVRELLLVTEAMGARDDEVRDALGAGLASLRLHYASSRERRRAQRVWSDEVLRQRGRWKPRPSRARRPDPATRDLFQEARA